MLPSKFRLVGRLVLCAIGIYTVAFAVDGSQAVSSSHVTNVDFANNDIIWKHRGEEFSLFPF